MKKEERDRFIKFMKKNRAWQEYGKAHRARVLEQPKAQEIGVFLCTVDSRSAIDSAFVWKTTALGYNYWAALSKKWTTEIKENMW